MEVTSISEGLILDHIPAGTAFKVLRYLHIDEKTARLALIMNASSVRYGTKDIIKIEGRSEIDLNVLALVAKDATVNIVHNGVIAEKLQPSLPDRVRNVIVCRTPRCITTDERGLDQMFHRCHTSDPLVTEYRCDYCDEKAEL